MLMNQGGATVPENKSHEIPFGWVLIGIGTVTALIMMVVLMFDGGP